MESCQPDFGTCGDTGIHPPISSDPATMKTSTSTTSSSASPTGTGISTDQNIDYWTFKGCWTESFDNRALSSKTAASDEMTLDSCAAFCKGFEMFGVEYSRECKFHVYLSLRNEIANEI